MHKKKKVISSIILITSLISCRYPEKPIFPEPAPMIAKQSALEKIKGVFQQRRAAVPLDYEIIPITKQRSSKYIYPETVCVQFDDRLEECIEVGHEETITIHAKVPYTYSRWKIWGSNGWWWQELRFTHKVQE